MINTEDMNPSADGRRALALDRYYFALECARAFKRMRRIAFSDSVSRFLARGRIALAGQGWRGRRSTDLRKAIVVKLDSVGGYIEPDGRVAPGRKGFSRRLLPHWSAILSRGGAPSLPPPRAYRIDGKWYLESSMEAVFALEAAYALGADALRVAVPLLALKPRGGALPGEKPRRKTLTAGAELLAG
jgi:hypothetical protein